MTIKIDIEQTTFPGELGSRADFAATIVAGGTAFEFDLTETKSFLSNPIYNIFESLKDCDPQALQAIAENYEQGASIIFNDQVLTDDEKQDVVDVCQTTVGMEF
jgi:hypothetical protein